MNLVRSTISVFLVALLVVAIAGWIWAGGLTPEKITGARFALALCGLSSLGCLTILWRAKHPTLR